MTDIKILDCLCGQGKSTFVKNMIAENPQKKYLYIAPYLSECHRFAGTAYDLKDVRKKPLFVQDSKWDYVHVEPTNPYERSLTHLNFRHPNTRNSEGSKEASLCNLLSAGHNIVSTHALFTDLGSNAIASAKDYTLIIDETVNVYELDSRKKDVDYCLNHELMYLDADGITLRFNRANLGVAKGGEDTAVGSRYEDLAVQCDLGQLLFVNGKAVVWELSIELIKSFKEVWVCTYMFENSDMCSYFKKHELEYEYVQIDGAKRSVDVAHLIEVVTDRKLNSVGEIVELSSSASKRDLKDDAKSGLKKNFIRDSLKNNLHNLVNQKWKAKADDRLWTAYKDQEKHIGNSKYSKQFLAFNYKATNEFINVHHVAFMLDVYQNPLVQQVCLERGVETSNDHFAISTLIQFVFRSAVRKGEPIKLYLPSLRMRKLLERWKNGEFD